MKDVRLREGHHEETAELGLEPGRGNSRAKAVRLEETRGLKCSRTAGRPVAGVEWTGERVGGVKFREVKGTHLHQRE